MAGKIGPVEHVRGFGLGGIMPNSGFNAQTPSSDLWRTPSWLFRALDTEFGFTYDAAANEIDHLCPRWTPDIDSRTSQPTDRVYINPPYSLIDRFVEEALGQNILWVMLLPSRTGSAWFQQLNESPRVEFRFLRKRIEFLLPDGTPSGSPRFDSIIAIVRPRA